MIYVFHCDKCHRDYEIYLRMMEATSNYPCEKCGGPMWRNFKAENHVTAIPYELHNPEGITRKDLAMMQKRSEYEGRPMIPWDKKYDNHPMFRPREKGDPPKVAFEKKMMKLREKVRAEKRANKRITINA